MPLASKSAIIFVATFAASSLLMPFTTYFNSLPMRAPLLALSFSTAIVAAFYASVIRSYSLYALAKSSLGFISLVTTASSFNVLGAVLQNKHQYLAVFLSMLRSVSISVNFSVVVS